MSFNVVIVDDLSYRHAWVKSIDFSKESKEDSIVFTSYQVSDNFISDLKKGKLPEKIDVLFLDHDMDNSTYDGRGVVSELIDWFNFQKKKTPKINLIVLQSDNTPFRNRMEYMLKNSPIPVSNYVNNLKDGESNSYDLICWLENNEIKSKNNPSSVKSTYSTYIKNYEDFWTFPEEKLEPYTPEIDYKKYLK